jgi:FMN-dependent NADH-azoreductase
MTKVLVLDSSAAGGASVSKQLTAELVARWRALDPAVVVTHRDLGADPLPHLTAERLPGLAGRDDSEAARDTLRLADELVAELTSADVILIGAPMYNFGITSTLKAWFDHVLRAGITFRYTPEGPQGLVTGKRAVVVETRGGFYSEGPAIAMDSQEPHLRAMLGFVGITDVTFVRAERLAISPEAREAAISAALDELRGIAVQTLARAA